MPRGWVVIFVWIFSSSLLNRQSSLDTQIQAFERQCLPTNGSKRLASLRVRHNRWFVPKFFPGHECILCINESGIRPWYYRYVDTQSLIKSSIEKVKYKMMLELCGEPLIRQIFIQISNYRLYCIVQKDRFKRSMLSYCPILMSVGWFAWVAFLRGRCV